MHPSPLTQVLKLTKEADADAKRQAQILKRTRCSDNGVVAHEDTDF